MKLSNFRRILTDDFAKEYQALIEKLCNYINPNTELVYTALSNRLTFTDNFDATVKIFSVTVDANGTPTSTTTIPLNIVNNTTPKASGSLVIKADNLTNSNVYPTGGVFLSFTQSGNIITITNITGLPANNKFNLSTVMFH